MGTSTSRRANLFSLHHSAPAPVRHAPVLYVCPSSLPLKRRLALGGGPVDHLRLKPQSLAVAGDLRMQGSQEGKKELCQRSSLVAQAAWLQQCTP